MISREGVPVLRVIRVFLYKRTFKNFYPTIYALLYKLKHFLKLRLTCQNDMYLSGFGIHFLGLFCFLYVLLFAKAYSSYVSFPNFWGLAILMKYFQTFGV